MTWLDRFDRALTHPVTIVSVLIGAAGSFLNIPFISALLATLWAQAGTVFAGVSLLATQGWLPAGTGEAAVLVAGALFLGRITDKIWDGLERRLKQ